MKQFVLPGTLVPGQRCPLNARDTRYLVSVRRHADGDRLVVMDASARLFIAELHIVDVKSDVFLTICEEKKTDSGENTPGSPDTPWIELLQCLPKARKMDQIIRQTVEAGVCSIVPVISEHSIPKLDPEDRGSGKSGRLQRIVREAVQQSGAELVPLIQDPVPVKDLPSPGPGEISLFCDEKGEHCQPLHTLLEEPWVKISVLVGPEGGFSEKERATLVEKGFKPVYFGSRILRTETAGVYALASIRTVVTERKIWKKK